MNCPECLCAFSACECPGDTLERLGFFVVLFAVVAFLVCSCGPCDCETAKDAGRPRPVPVLPPLEPDPSSLEYGDPPTPCGRTTAIVIDAGETTHTWHVPLPCRPYSRITDDPRPPTR